MKKALWMLVVVLLVLASNVAVSQSNKAKVVGNSVSQPLTSAVKATDGCAELRAAQMAFVNDTIAAAQMSPEDRAANEHQHLAKIRVAARNCPSLAKPSTPLRLSGR